MVGKINNIFLTITLSLLIVLLVLNLTAKKAVNEVITKNWQALISNNSDKEKNGFFDKFFNSEEMAKSKEKFMEATHYDELGEVMGDWTGMQDVFDQYFNTFLEEQEKKLSPEQQNMIKVAKFVTKDGVKKYLMIFIAFNILLLVASTWSLYKWIKNVSISLILSGVSLMGLCEWIKNLINSVISSIEVNLHMITTPAIILITVGVLLLAAFFVFDTIKMIDKKVDKEEKKEVANEVS